MRGIVRVVMFESITSSYVIFNNVLFAGLLFAFAYALFLSVFARDLEFIRGSTVRFVIECIVVFFTPAIPILVFMWTQGVSWNVARRWVVDLGFKLVVLHILFHTSGMYTMWFEKQYGLN